MTASLGERCCSSPSTNMVTMNSDKSATRRKQEPSNGGCAGSSSDANSPPVTVLTVHQFPSTDESPNHLVYRKVYV